MQQPWENDPVVGQPTPSARAPWEQDAPVNREPGTVEVDMQGNRLTPFPTQTSIPPAPQQLQEGRIASTGIAGIPVMDEASGALAALSAALRGKPAGEAYASERDKFRSAASNYQRENPWSAAGMAGVGSLPLALATGGLAPAATLGGRMGQGALISGTLGTATGFTGGEGGFMPRLENAAKVGIPSAIIGGATPAIAEGLGAAGQWLGQKLVTGSGTKAAAEEARAAGFVLPPNMAQDRPSLLSKLLSGIAGKTKVQQVASATNQDAVTNIAAESLGLPQGTTLSEKTFENVRNSAGKAYEAVRKSGIDIIPDQQFRLETTTLSNVDPETAQFFPDLVSNKEVEALSNGLASKEKFSPGAGIGLVRRLRHDATANLKNAMDPDKQVLGLAQRNAANAIDDLMERRLAEAGKPDLVEQYRNARQLIAMSHDVETATTPAGDVSARVLSRLAAKGRPLSGDLKAVADAAANFPKAFQNPETFGGVEPLSIFDIAAGTGATMAGRPDVGAMVLARPILRGTVLSNPYQNLTLGSGPTGVAGPGAMNLDPRLLSLLPPQILNRLMSQPANQPR